MISQTEVYACAQTMRPWENGRCAFFPTLMNACLVFKLPPLTFFCICVRIMSKGCKSAEAETPDRLPLIHDAVTDTLPSPPATPPIPAPTLPIPARVTCLERNTSWASPGRDLRHQPSKNGSNLLERDRKSVQRAIWPLHDSGKPSSAHVSTTNTRLNPKP